MTNVNANVVINVNAKSAIAQIQALQNQVNSLNRTLALTGNEQGLRRVNQGFIDAANASGQFRAKIVPVTSSVDQFTQKLEKNKFTLGEYTRYAGSQIPGLGRMFRKEFDTMQRVAESRVRKIATAYTSLGESANGARKAIALTPTGALNMKDYSVQAELAAQKAAIFNKILRDGSTRMLNWGKNTQWAGRQLMVGFSIPLAMLGTAAAKTFKELDKASVSFRRVYGDLSTTTQEMERNLQAVKDLGQEYTKYGIAVADTIDLASRVAATGAENESLMAATKETLRLATLGQMEYNTALDATISMQTAFKISNEDLAGTIDYLNAVENQTILTMEDMAAAIPRVAPVVKGLGGDVKDLAAMMTALREGGVTAEQGANAIKSGLGRLINPTKAAREQMSKFGISINSIIEQNRGDLMGMITSFGDALAKLGDFEQQQVLEKVFGKYQYARLGALFKNISNDAGQASRAMELAGMSATELAQLSEKELSKISESTSVKFEAAMERLKVSISPIGEQFMKAIMPVVEFFSKLFDKFNEMPDVIKNVVVIGTAALAGLGPVILMTVGLMANGLANITKGAILIRNAFNRLRGSHKSLEYIATAELEAATATGQLEGRMSGLTGVMLNQQAAIRRLIGLYAELATAAGTAASRMPAGMGGTRAPRVVRANNGLTMVPGTGNSDTVPALLTPGESVITKEATAKYAPILQSMNEGKLPGFMLGGVGIGISKLLGSFRKTSTRVAGARIKGKSSSDRTVLGDEDVWSYQDIRNVKKKESWPERLPQKYFDRLKTKGGEQSGIGSSLVVMHMHTPRFSKSLKTIDPQSLILKESKKSGVKPTSELLEANMLDLLPNSYFLGSRTFNTQVARSRGVASQFGQADPLDFIGLASFLHRRRVPENIIDDVTTIAAKQVNKAMSSQKGRKWDEESFAALVEGASSRAIRTSKKFRSYADSLSESDRSILFANKGYVPGTGNKDTIPALLTPGESVVTKEATAKYGPILQAMNDGSVALRAEGGDAETGGDISPERYREQGSKPVRSHGTGGVDIDTDTLAEIVDDEFKKNRPNTALLRAASAQGYSNWIYGESQMANDNMLTGIERGATFSRDAGAMREQIMAPLVEAIAQEAPDLDLKNSPRVRSFIDSMADNMHEELTAIGDTIVDEAEFTSADRRAFERALENSDLTEQERTAVRAARENIYTAKVRGPQGEHLGRVALNPKSYRNIPVPSQGQDIAPFLTPEGLLARDAKRSGQPQTQSRGTRAVRPSKVVQPRSGKEIRTTTVNPGTTVDRAYAMAASESISREEALSRVRALEEKESKKRILERARFFRSKGKSLEESLRLARQEEAQLKKEWKEENIRNKNEKERIRKDNATRKRTQSAIRERRQSGELQRRYEAINPRAKWARRFGRTSDSVRERLGTARSGMGMLGRNMGRVSGGLSMGLGMASMMPMMMADEQGKFMGMDAGAATGGLMGASMLTGILPMLGPAAGPVAAVAVAAGAVAFGLNKWRGTVDEAAKKSAELGASIGGTSNALNTMAKLLGVSTPNQRVAQQQLVLSEEEQQNFGELQSVFEGEAGQQFIEDLKNSTSAERFEKLSGYLKNAIASGIMDQTAANTFAKVVSSSLEDAVLGRSVMSAIKDQETGYEAMLDIARTRMSAVEDGGGAYQNLVRQDTVEETEASSVVGSSIQIIQDFSNAAALAKEEYRDGTISYEEYKSALEESREAQRKYTDALTSALTKTEDFGATMQSWKDQLILSGLSEEQVGALESAATSTNAIGFSGANGGIMQDIAQFANIPGRTAATIQTIFSGQASWGDLVGAWFQGEVKSVNEELLAQMTAATNAGMDPATVAAVADQIKSNAESAAAKTYTKYAGTGNEFELAVFAQNMESMGVQGLEGESLQKYIDIGIRVNQEGGVNLQEYMQLINSIPTEKRLDFITSISGDVSPEMIEILMSMSSLGTQTSEALLGSKTVSALTEQSGATKGEPPSVAAEIADDAEDAAKGIYDAAKGLSDVVGDEAAATIVIDVEGKYNGDPENSDDIIRDLKDIENAAEAVVKGLPQEYISMFGIDFSVPETFMNLTKEDLDNFNLIGNMIGNLPEGLKYLGIDLATESNGKPKDPKQWIADTRKAAGLLEKIESGDEKVRKTAMMELYSLVNGEEVSFEQVDAAEKALIERWGKKTITELGTDVYRKAMDLEIEAQGLRDAAQGFDDAASELDPKSDRGMIMQLTEKAARLRAAADSVEREADDVISRGTDVIGGGTAPSGGGGGGGGAESPLKSFKKSILDQIKLWVDADAKLKDLNAVKSKFVNDLIEGNGIFGQLANVKGIDMANLQNIMGMGPKGAKDFIKKYIKDGKLIKEGQRLLNAANIAGAGQTIGEAVIAQRTAGTQTRAANILGRRGASRELIDTIAGDPAKAAQLVALQKNINNNVEGSRKAMNKFINEQQKAIDKAKELAKELDPAQWASDEWQKYAEQTNAYFDKQFADIETNANLIFKATYGRSVGETEALIRANEDLIDAERDRIQVIEDSIRVLETRKGKEKDYSDWGTEQIQKEIDSNNRLISGLERRNELDQRRVEEIQRASEIRSRDAEAINHDLDLMSQAEDDINEAYDKKIEALDEIVKINDHLIQQQQQQLNLSRAISEGDIYAATAAAQEMRASSAGFAAEQVRAGIEQGRQNQIDNLLTAGGLTREEAEKEIRNIDEQNYQASLLARKIEDDIYTRTLNEIIPLKDKEYNLNLALQSVQDQIAVKQLEIRDIERGKVEELQRANDLMREQINDHLDNIQTQQEGVKNLAGQTREEFDNIAKSIEASNAWTIAQGLDTAEGARQAKNLADQWEVVGNAIQRARKAMLTDVGKLEKVELTKEYTAEDRAKDIADRRAAYEAEVAGIFADPAAISDTSLGGTPTLVGSGADLVGNGMGGAFAGGLMKYAVGGKVMGSGARDSIPTMLSPGEFVVRKAMVDKYGMPMFNAINQGSFSLPRYDTGEIEMPETIVSNSGNTTNVSAPVYNTYDMKFSINGTNANADDIANRVMMKMAQVQGQNIRSSRGY